MSTDIEMAFPFVSHGGVHEHQFVSFGLTKREYFAAKALQSLIYLDYLTVQDRTKAAVQYADALIDELNNGI